jgi:plastocyanin
MLTTPPPHRLAIAALSAVLVLLLAACGGGGDDPTVANGADGQSPTEPAPQDDATTSSATADDAMAGTECPSDAPLPEDTDAHGAISVDSSTVELEAGDQFFKPTCLTDVAQGTLTLTVANTGQALHNIRVEDQDIDTDIQPGESVSVDVEVGSEPVVLTCKYHKGLGMHGVIIPAA